MRLYTGAFEPGILAYSLQRVDLHGVENNWSGRMWPPDVVLLQKVLECECAVKAGV